MTGHPRTVRRLLPFAAVMAVVVAGATFTSCGSGAGSGAGDGRLRVEASFYPLQWVAQQVGGDRVSVTNLTPAGAEPHDLELTPRQVAALSEADVVLYLSGFQPAVDDALGEAGGLAFDSRQAGRVDLGSAGSHDHGDDHDDDHDEAGHPGEGGSVDPHFWLDPTRLADVATALADTFAEADPEHAADYRAGAAATVARLTDLDRELEAGLAECRRRQLVTSHEAFGYLADRYDLDQVGITGLTPAQEPSAGALADVVAFVQDHDVRTIYFETLVSPAVAETVAGEAGVETAVLDPIEGLTDASAGDDYLEVMRSNLSALQAGQPCP